MTTLKDWLYERIAEDGASDEFFQLGMKIVSGYNLRADPLNYFGIQFSTQGTFTTEHDKFTIDREARGSNESCDKLSDSSPKEQNTGDVSELKILKTVSLAKENNNQSITSLKGIETVSKCTLEKAIFESAVNELPTTSGSTKEQTEGQELFAPSKTSENTDKISLRNESEVKPLNDSSENQSRAESEIDFLELLRNCSPISDVLSPESEDSNGSENLLTPQKYTNSKKKSEFSAICGSGEIYESHHSDNSNKEKRERDSNSGKAVVDDVLSGGINISCPKLVQSETLKGMNNETKETNENMVIISFEKDPHDTNPASGISGIPHISDHVVQDKDTSILPDIVTIEGNPLIEIVSDKIDTNINTQVSIGNSEHVETNRFKDGSKTKLKDVQVVEKGITSFERKSKVLKRGNMTKYVSKDIGSLKIKENKLNKTNAKVEKSFQSSFIMKHKDISGMRKHEKETERNNNPVHSVNHKRSSVPALSSAENRKPCDGHLPVSSKKIKTSQIILKASKDTTLKNPSGDSKSTIESGIAQVNKETPFSGNVGENGENTQCKISELSIKRVLDKSIKVKDKAKQTNNMTKILTSRDESRGPNSSAQLLKRKVSEDCEQFIKLGSRCNTSSVKVNYPHTSTPVKKAKFSHSKDVNNSLQELPKTEKNEKSIPAANKVQKLPPKSIKNTLFTKDANISETRITKGISRNEVKNVNEFEPKRHFSRYDASNEGSRTSNAAAENKQRGNLEKNSTPEDRKNVSFPQGKDTELNQIQNSSTDCSIGNESFAIEVFENKYSPSFRPYFRCHICVDLYFTSQERFDFHNKVTHNTKKMTSFEDCKQLSSAITSPKVGEHSECKSHDLWNESGTPEKVRHVLSSIIGDDSIKNKDSAETKTNSLRYNEESRIQRKELDQESSAELKVNQERNKNSDYKIEKQLGGQVHDRAEFDKDIVGRLSGATEQKTEKVVNDSQKCKGLLQKSKGDTEIDCRIMTQKSMKCESRKHPGGNKFENPNQCKDTIQTQDKHSTQKDNGKSKKLSLHKLSNSVVVMNEKVNAKATGKLMTNEPSHNESQLSQNDSNKLYTSNKDVAFQKLEKESDNKVAISKTGDITSTRKHQSIDKPILADRQISGSKKDIFKSGRNNMCEERNSKKTGITKGNGSNIIKTETNTDNSKSIKGAPRMTINENVDKKSKQNYDNIQQHQKQNPQKENSDKVENVHKPRNANVVNEKVISETDCEMTKNKSSRSSSKSSQINLNVASSSKESVSCNMSKDSDESEGKKSTSVDDMSLHQKPKPLDKSHFIDKRSRFQSGEHSLSVDRNRKKSGLKQSEQDQHIDRRRGRDASSLTIKNESKETLEEEMKSMGKHLERTDDKFKKSLVQRLFQHHDDSESDKDSMRVCVDSQSSDECLDSDLEQIEGHSTLDSTNQSRQHENKSKEEHDTMTLQSDETVERRNDIMQEDEDDTRVSYVSSNSSTRIHARNKSDFDNVNIDKEGERKRNLSFRSTLPDGEYQERNNHDNKNPQSHKERKHHRKIIYLEPTRNRHHSRNDKSIEYDKDLEMESNEISVSEKSRDEKRNRDSYDDLEGLQERERKRHCSNNSKTSDTANEEKRRHCSNNSRTSGGAMETETRLDGSYSSNPSEDRGDRKRYDSSPKGKDSSSNRKRHESASTRRRHGSSGSVGSRSSLGRVSDKNEDRKHCKYGQSPERRKRPSPNDRSKINRDRRSRSRSRDRFDKKDRKRDPIKDKRSRVMSTGFQRSSRFHNRSDSFRENIEDRRSSSCDRKVYRNPPRTSFSFSKYDKNIRYRYSKIDMAMKRKESNHRIKQRKKQTDARKTDTQYKSENRTDRSAENTTKCDPVESEKIENSENSLTNNKEESYLCPKCKEEFKTSYECQKHMFSEHLAVFKCYQCKIGFATPDEHGSHVSARHERKRPTGLDESYNKIQEREESKQPTESSHSHDNDGESNSRGTKQEDQPREEDMADYYTFCRICHTEFRTRRELLDHLWFRHKKRVFDSNLNKRPPPREHTSGYDPSLTCRICHLRLRSKDELFKHLEKKHDIQPKGPRGNQVSLKGLQHL